MFGFARSLTDSRLWPRDLEPRLIASLIWIVLATLLFIVVVDAVGEGDTEKIDERVLRFFRDKQNLENTRGPWWVSEMMRDFTALGGPTVVLASTVIISTFLRLAGHKTMARFLIIAAGGGTLVALGLKEIFDRPRPEIVPHISRVGTSSFPSTHSLLAAVAYLTLGSLLTTIVKTRWEKLYILGIALLVTFLVGLSRVFLGVHYPSDVLGGWLIGLIWSEVCWFVYVHLQRRREDTGAALVEQIERHASNALSDKKAEISSLKEPEA